VWGITGFVHAYLFRSAISTGALLLDRARTRVARRTRHEKISTSDVPVLIVREDLAVLELGGYLVKPCPPWVRL